MRAMSSSQRRGSEKIFSFTKCDQSHCALCKERLKGHHSHPGQWKPELQQLLQWYSCIALSLCVCWADELSLRRKASGKVTGEFIIRRFTPCEGC